MILLILSGNLFANAQNTTSNEKQNLFETSQTINDCQDCDQSCQQIKNCHSNQNYNSQCKQHTTCQSTRNQQNRCDSDATCSGTCNK